MKKLLGLFLICPFAIMAFSVEANSCESLDKEPCVKADVNSDLVIEHGFSYDFDSLVSDGQFIDMTIDNSCEYLQPAEEVHPGYYDYAVVKHIDPGDS